MIADNDTIVAPATARGRAALSIVRMSGPNAREIAAACFKGANLSSVPTHTVHFGRVIGRKGEVVDQVVATVFEAPRSATGEHLIEFTCHGGDFAPQMVLESLLHAGARMAEPGEFTLRSFLNGKLDLAQAEAVADVIHASSSSAHRVSMSQLEGHYSKLLADLRTELLDLGAMLELELDFSEEDVEFADRQKLFTLLRNSKDLLTELVHSYRTGSRIRDGIRVIIAGRPNAGKSTLLNALVGKDRSIVSPVPGTTRDEIEAEVEIDGVSFRFHDTAGLRETSDAIEQEGVRRALKSIEHADIVLYVFDSTLELERADITEIQNAASASASIILVANKSDITESGTYAAERGATDQDIFGLLRVIRMSALLALTVPNELEELVGTLKELALEGLETSDSSRVVTNLRHKNHLEKANGAVTACLDALENGASGDLVSIELRQALFELGAITGEITNEDILDSIFSRFCIGK